MHGGWQGAYDGGEELIMEWESRTEALLLGRKTYDIWARSWGVWDENAEGLQGEFTRRYNQVPKYVACVRFNGEASQEARGDVSEQR